MKLRWRRFVPRRAVPAVSLHDSSTLFGAAEILVGQLTAHRNLRKAQIDDLEPMITSLRGRHDTTALLAMLILQSPRAAHAQRQMDGHPHGYHDRNKRLYELIDFNDVFVSCVLALDESQLDTFNEQAKLAMDRFCKTLGVKCFSNEQWEAITHGLSREVAVYFGALHEGLSARMTSRTDDAKGIDMVITDMATARQMNVDVKTRSAFHFRLKDLEREGRISADATAQAEADGYCRVTNGHGSDAVRVVLLRIDEQSYGQIRHFRFEQSQVLGATLRALLQTTTTTAAHQELH